MAANHQILENEKKIKEEFEQQLADKFYDKDYLETIERLRTEHEYDNNSREKLAILNGLEDDKIRKMVMSLEGCTFGFDESNKDIMIQKIKRYIADKKSEIRFLDSASKKFKEGLEKCPELSEINKNSAEKPEDVSLAYFLTEFGSLWLESDAVSPLYTRSYSSNRYTMSRDVMAATLKEIATLLTPSNGIIDVANKKTQCILKSLVFSCQTDNRVEILSTCHPEFKLFLHALQTTTTLTELNLYYASAEDCLSIISALAKNSSIRTFYWPESLGAFNNPKGPLGAKIREKTIEFLDSSSATAVSKVDVLKNLALGEDNIVLFNTLNALRNSRLTRIEISIEPSDSAAAPYSDPEKHWTQEPTDLQESLVSVKWQYPFLYKPNTHKYESDTIPQTIQPLSIYSNITSLYLDSPLIFDELPVLAPLPLQDLTLYWREPNSKLLSYDPLANWRATLKKLFLRYERIDINLKLPTLDNLCQNLSKLTELNTLEITTTVFCPYSLDEGPILLKEGLTQVLAAINKLPLTSLKIIDECFSKMCLLEKWHPDIRKLFENALAKNLGLLAAQVFDHNCNGSIPMPVVESLLEKNKIQNKSWSSIALLISCIRANPTSAIRHSILPLLPNIQELMGIKCEKTVPAAQDATVAATAANVDTTTETTVTTTATAATTATNAVTVIPVIAFSREARNLQNKGTNNNGLNTVTSAASAAMPTSATMLATTATVASAATAASATMVAATAPDKKLDKAGPK